MSREKLKPGKPTIAILGAGKLAGFLVPSLSAAGYRITEIIHRTEGRSARRAQRLASSVGARVATPETARYDADLLWFAVPDSEIRLAAAAISRHLESRRPNSRPRFAFHSSGALASEELIALRKGRTSVASVHPLMTFVPGANPRLTGVPFAVEGDRSAIRVARRIVRDLGATSFALSTRRKPAYHAWATMTSPLLVAYFTSLEDFARNAGLKPALSRRMSLPILRQTIENYAHLGAAGSFSGAYIRGDAATVAKHLALLKRKRANRDVYVALAEAALDNLPVKNRQELRRLLRVAVNSSRKR